MTNKLPCRDCQELTIFRAVAPSGELYALCGSCGLLAFDADDLEVLLDPLLPDNAE